jgi:hypothetical protein
LAISVSIALPNPALAETADQAVRKNLEERTVSFCKNVIPQWLASEKGVADPAVRAGVVDCYLGHARLSILGVEGKFPISESALSELPAMLLRQETGINLDIYRPLAGRTVRNAVKGE